MHGHHRSPSPREIHDLPVSFHSTGSPASQLIGLPGVASSSTAATTSVQGHSISTPASSSIPSLLNVPVPPLPSSTTINNPKKRSRDEQEEGATLTSVSRSSRQDEEEDKSEGPAQSSIDRGKGRQSIPVSDQDMMDLDDECSTCYDEAMGLPISLANAKFTSTTNNHQRRTSHHPQNDQQHSLSLTEPSATGAIPFNGFGVKGTPGGDCKRICLRHQRMVDAGARLDLQKRLDTLSATEQQTANTIWSLFSASSGAARTLTLRGLLSICCPSQLSFLTEELKAECRLDPFAILPRELALKCMSFLDAMSLGRAAQVSKNWKNLADDDLLWRTMCEQHIERKCEKCGWGLPLLEKKRRQRSPAVMSNGASSLAQAQANYDNAKHNHTPLPKTLEEALSSPNLINNNGTGPSATSSTAAKRARLERSSTANASSMYFNSLNRNSPGPSSPSNSAFPTSASTSSSQYPTSSTSDNFLQPVVTGPDPNVQLQLQQQQQQQQSTIPTQITRPWKSVYCERLAIARNWARGNCKFRVLSGHSDAITCLQIDETLSNPPYPVLMTGSWDRTVRIWNAETGQCVSVLRGHTRGVRCLQFDSVKLITGGMDSKIKLWNWKTGKCLRTLEGHRDSVISLCFDKHVLASGSSDSTIKVWDFNTAECFTLRGHREWVNQVKIWSPDSPTDCTVTPAENELTRNGSHSNVGGDSPQPSSSTSHHKPTVKLLFSSSDDGTVKVWDLITRQCVRTLEGHVAQVQCLKILTLDDHSSTPFPMVQNNDDQNSYINASEANATAANNRSQVTNGNAYEGFFDDQQQQQQQQQQSEAGQAAFVPAAHLQQAAPNPLAFLEAANRPAPDPSTLPFIDFGNSPAPLLVSGSLDNTIKVWNVEEGTCARTMFGHIEGVWAVDMDKLRIVSASHDRTIKVWDRNGGKCLHTLVGHRGAVTSIGLGDDKIISGSDDCTVRIWSFAQ